MNLKLGQRNISCMTPLGLGTLCRNMGNQSNMLCLYVKQDISKFIVSTLLEGFVRNTGRKRMAALIRKFQEKLLFDSNS